MSAYVNLNGTVLPADEARVSLSNHGFLYGDGLFETLRVYDGRFFRLEAHLNRLEESAARLEFALPWPREFLRRALRETIDACAIASGAVRLTVSRGAGPPVPDPAACTDPLFFVTARPAAPPDDAAFERGQRVCLAGTHPCTWIPGIKTLSYAPFQHARRTARRLGFDEGLLEREGFVVESATANVFAIRSGVLWTPPASSGCLLGVTRAAIIEIAAREGLPVKEADLETRTLAQSDELFLSNSVIEVMPVVALGSAAIGSGRPGDVTRRIRVAYQDVVKREL